MSIFSIHRKPGLFITLLMLWSLSCGTSRVRVKEADQDQTKRFKTIKDKADKNKRDQAIVGLTGFIQDNPATTLTDDALILMGDLQYQKKDFVAALKNYEGVLVMESPREAEARTGAARCHLQLQQTAKAEAILGPVLQIKDSGSDILLAALKVWYMIQLQKNDRMETLRTLIQLSQSSTTPADNESFRLRAHDLVESKLTDAELEKITSDSAYKPVWGSAYFRLGLMAFEQSRYREAASHLKDAKQFLKDNQVIERVQDLLNQIDSRSEVNTQVVGAVLPLSGRLSKVGYKTLRGIELGLGIYGNVRSKIRLAIVDSEGSAELARNGVKRLVIEDHALAIIGGVQSKTASAEASKAQEFGVPIVCLSQKAGLTDIGPYVFRNAITSEMQVRKLVTYAMETKHMTRFAILFPNDSYGVEYSNLFWDEVLARGGKISSAQMYDPKETDFRGPIRRLVGTFYPEDRAQEYRVRLKEWQAENADKPGAKKEAPEDLLPPVIDFDALFIPDSAKAIGQIAPMLAYNDVKDVALMGTNLWNTNEFVTRGERFVEGSLFVDNFITKEHFKQVPFFREFVAVFGYEPDLFELQGYEAGVILRNYIKAGVSSRISLQDVMTKLKNFPSPTGFLEMSVSREVSRDLTALTVERGAITPVSSSH